MSHIRKAYAEEEQWVNERYKEIGFVPSNVGRELVAVAEHEGSRAALGRLVPVNADCAELGGIYVLQEFRGLGIATELVDYLLREGTTYKKIFCLPFAHVEHLYLALGFRRYDGAENVPQEIQRKHRWCNNHYEHGTLLLVRP
jgi:N-acetylglutamate synthase-like GNAT family acetyltransferase